MVFMETLNVFFKQFYWGFLQITSLSPINNLHYSFKHYDKRDK